MSTSPQRNLENAHKPAPRRARVVIADDHPLTLEGMCSVLAPHHDIVATAGDGLAVVDLTTKHRPDLAILDITMPLLNGIDAAGEIRKHAPLVKILFVTMHRNPAYVEAALKTGGSGYVLKSSAREELLDAIQAVLNGRVYVSGALSSGRLEGVNDPDKAASTYHLSTREREILQMVAEGRAAKEIAFHLNISVKTVAFHRENIKRKLGLPSTAELTRYAIEQGLI